MGSQDRLNQMMSEASNGNGENFKLGIILLAVFIGVLLIIFGVYLFRSKAPINQTNKPNSNQPINQQAPTNNQANTTLINQTNNIKDVDHDGLSDDDETNTYKTDPNKADTDGDGLTDREEVKVYKTDPLKSDTDGDGISDGQEIKSGTDPLNPAPGAKWPPTPKDFSIK